MGIFGWSYPPGCSSVPGDEDEPPCEMCGKSVDDCVCAECPKCGEFGNPECYTIHGMVMTMKQKIGMAELAVENSKQRLADDVEYLDWLRDQTE